MRRPHTELKNTHKDEDIWVIGAGASLNFVDKSFFDNKLVIGVNRVCKFFRCDYIVSKDARGFGEITENLKEAKLILSEWESGNPKTWKGNLINESAELNKVNYEHYYFTHPNKPYEEPILEEVGTENIIVSHSSITSAIHLAAYMGAKNIILCGHDCGMVNGEITINGYYGKLKPDQGDLKSYHHWLARSIERHTINLKKKLKEVYGTNVVSLNPFINLGLEGNKYNKEGTVTQKY